MKSKNFPIAFKVGDIVEATDWIRRLDRKTNLYAGERARVTEVYRSTPDSPQIITIEPLKGQMPIGSIFCFNTVPLRLVENEP